MTTLFGVNIAALIHQNMSAGLLPLTLVVVTPGTRTPGALSDGTQPTTTSSTGRGIKQAVSKFRDDDLTRAGDVEILIITDSLSPPAVPKSGDRITMSGSTFYVVQVKSDPADATFSCLARA